MTPVILFTFKRLDTLLLVINALQMQSKPIPLLIIFSDAPRNAREAIAVEQVRTQLRAIDWVETSIIERQENHGTVHNIVKGLQSVFETYQQAIIVEDDVLPSPLFYETMCILLDKYANEENIFSVGGYPAIRNDALKEYPFDVFFSHRFSVWGWATWRKKWQLVVPILESQSLPFDENTPLPKYSDADTQDYLQQFQKGDLLWDVPIYLFCLYKELHHVHTKHYLIQNIGLDTGTHAPGYSLKHTLEFCDNHNTIEHILPTRFPSYGTMMDITSKAVQTYNHDWRSALMADATEQEKYQQQAIYRRIYYWFRHMAGRFRKLGLIPFIHEFRDEQIPYLRRQFWLYRKNK